MGNALSVNIISFLLLNSSLIRHSFAGDLGVYGVKMLKWISRNRP